MSAPGPRPWHAEAMRMKAEGLPYPEIADRLGLAFNTIVKFFNPEYAARQAAYSAEWAKRRRAHA